MALDGKDVIKPTPFDAHEQATRGEHIPTGPDSPDKTDVQEYPKAVDHVDHPDPVAVAAGHQEPVVVKSAEEEKAYQDAKADEAKRE